MYLCIYVSLAPHYQMAGGIPLFVVEVIDRLFLLLVNLVASQRRLKRYWGRETY